MNYRARIRALEKSLRREAQAKGPAIEYELSESFLPNVNGAALAGPGISKRNVVFIMPRPGEKAGAEAAGQGQGNAKE